MRTVGIRSGIAVRVIVILAILALAFAVLRQGAVTKTLAPRVIGCPDCFVATNARSVHVHLFR